MAALLNLRVIAALALVAVLAFTHFAAYRKGKANVRLEWQASVAQANADARKLEQQRQRRADEAGRLAAAREAGIRADAVRAAGAADGLRDALDATERVSKESHDAATRSLATVRTLLESCTAEYRFMGEEAARHASDSLKLQQAWPQ